MYNILTILPGRGDSFWDRVRIRTKYINSILPNDINIIIETIGEYSEYKKQTHIMESYLTEETDIIVIGPTSSTKIAPAVKNYNKKDTPVVLLDSKLDDIYLESIDACYNFYVGSDNEKIGKLAAQIVSKQTKDKKDMRICVLGGNPGHQTAIARRQSFIKNLSGIGEESVEVRDAKWRKDKAASTMRFFLSDGYPEAVFATSGAMTLGAIEAIKSARMYENGKRISERSARWPVLVGVDAMDNVNFSRKVYLEDGIHLNNFNNTLCYSINQRIDKIVDIAIEKCLMFILSNNIPKMENEEVSVNSFQLCYYV